jgi:hypothetical protein
LGNKTGDPAKAEANRAAGRQRDQETSFAARTAGGA